MKRLYQHISAWVRFIHPKSSGTKLKWSTDKQETKKASGPRLIYFILLFILFSAPLPIFVESSSAYYGGYGIQYGKSNIGSYEQLQCTDETTQQSELLDQIGCSVTQSMLENKEAHLSQTLLGGADTNYTSIDLPMEYEISAAIPQSWLNNIHRPKKIFVKDPYLFLSDSSNGLHIYDISDPSTPTEIGYYPLRSGVDIAIKGNYLFMDSGPHLVVLDISDVENPSYITAIANVINYPCPGNEYPWSYWNCSNYYESTYSAYSADTAYFYDQQDPYRTSYTTYSSMNFNQGLLYEDHELYKDNYRDSRDYMWGCGTYYGCMAEGTSMDTMSGGMEGDFSSQSPQTGYGTTGGSGGAGSTARLAVVGDYLYWVTCDYRIKVIDISDPETPFLAGEVSTQNLETIYPSGGYLFMGGTEGMYIYSIKDPVKPTLVGQFLHVRSCDPVVVRGDYAYVTLRSGNVCGEDLSRLDILDISDPTNPTLVKEYLDLDAPYGLTVDGDLVFICDLNVGLRVLDVSNLDNIHEIAQVPDLQSTDVVNSNYHSYLVGPDGLFIYDYASIPSLVKKGEILPVPPEQDQQVAAIADMQVDGDVIITSDNSGSLSSYKPNGNHGMNFVEKNSQATTHRFVRDNKPNFVYGYTIQDAPTLTINEVDASGSIQSLGDYTDIEMRSFVVNDPYIYALCRKEEASDTHLLQEWYIKILDHDQGGTIVVVDQVPICNVQGNTYRYAGCELLPGSEDTYSKVYRGVGSSLSTGKSFFQPMYVHQNHLFLVLPSDAIVVFDLSQPESPEQVMAVRYTEYALDMVVTNEAIYAITFRGLDTIKYSLEPSTMSMMHRINLCGMRYIEAMQDNIYIGGNLLGMVCLDITDPFKPNAVSVSNLNGLKKLIKDKAHNQVYAASNQHGLIGF